MSAVGNETPDCEGRGFKVKLEPKYVIADLKRLVFAGFAAGQSVGTLGKIKGFSMPVEGV